MSLDEIRQKVIFHNSVDVWISACGEKNKDWTNPEDYKQFIAHLLKNNLKLIAFNEKSTLNIVWRVLTKNINLLSQKYHKTKITNSR